jgi:hypothetical protein
VKANGISHAAASFTDLEDISNVKLLSLSLFFENIYIYIYIFFYL